MSWARKLFVETSSAPVLTSATTSFPTNYTTTWNTNTSDSTNVATSRITTTVWYAGTSTTSWNTNRTTTGTIASNTNTEFPTSGSYTTSWSDSRNTETGQMINTNTTTSYYSYWNANTSFYTQILTERSTPKTTTTPTNTSRSTPANVLVYYSTDWSGCVRMHPHLSVLWYSILQYRQVWMLTDASTGHSTYLDNYLQAWRLLRHVAALPSSTTVQYY